MHLTRRNFLKDSLGATGLLALSGAVPAFLRRPALAVAGRPVGHDSVLVVLQLSGGNDGLNTVVPSQDDAYHRSRPTLRLTAERVLQLENGLGLHPEMPAFARLYHEGLLSIIQGVGYPSSSRDHGAAMRAWHSAVAPGQGAGGHETGDRHQETGRSQESGVRSQTGWVGRACDRAYAAGENLPGAFVGEIKAPLGVRAETVIVPSVRALGQYVLKAESGLGEDFAPHVARLAQISRGAAEPLQLSFLWNATLGACAASQRLAAALEEKAPAERAGYPRFPLAQTLKTIARLIRAELGVRVYFAELGGGGIGGFDTHAGQAANHGALLRELSESVGAFLADLRRDKLLDSVLLLTFSEFGRTLAENGRRGTDHGAAAPMFLAGGKVKPGLAGAHPSLTDLDGGAPKTHTDFRRVYATVLEQWLGFDSEVILGEGFKPLEVLSPT
jgi:uncharacterized protein (DUF1501 family)